MSKPVISTCAFSAMCLAGLFALGAAAETGTLVVDITDLLGRPLPSKVELRTAGGTAVAASIPFKRGVGEASVPAGAYRAFTWVYDAEVPLLVDVQDLVVPAGGEALLPLNVAEAGGVKRRLREFDRDADLVLDRVEKAAGTDLEDAADFPGATPAPFSSAVIVDKPGWYRGDLHVRSKHGGGTESVAEIVERAAKADLDFIAIADRNTMAAHAEIVAEGAPEGVVVLPAIEWGDAERGVALLFGPRTLPPPPGRPEDDQAIAYVLQSQGGTYAIAHPCFPLNTWQRRVSDVNLVEVWCQGWRDVPPIGPPALDGMLRIRDRNRRLVLPIAKAANTARLSANGQGLLFYDLELERGLKASPIGGSLSSSPGIELGRPVTYVFSREKSAEGILEGLRLGHTFVSESVDGPKLFIEADLLSDGTADAVAGGIIPAGVPVVINVAVYGAKGAKVQLLRNGTPILTKKIGADEMTVQHKPLTQRVDFVVEGGGTPIGAQEPDDIRPAIYRAQVLAPQPEEGFGGGFGDAKIMAITAPIYTIRMKIVNERLEPTDAWQAVDRQDVDPVYIEQVEGPDGRPLFVNPEDSMQRALRQTFSPPPGSVVKELAPQRW